MYAIHAYDVLTTSVLPSASRSFDANDDHPLSRVGDHRSVVLHVELSEHPRKILCQTPYLGHFSRPLTIHAYGANVSAFHRRKMRLTL